MNYCSCILWFRQNWFGVEEIFKILQGNKRCGSMARLPVPRWPTSFICWPTLHTEAAYKHHTLHTEFGSIQTRPKTTWYDSSGQHIVKYKVGCMTCGENKNRVKYQPANCYMDAVDILESLPEFPKSFPMESRFPTEQILHLCGFVSLY